MEMIFYIVLFLVFSIYIAWDKHQERKREKESRVRDIKMSMLDWGTWWRQRDAMQFWAAAAFLRLSSYIIVCSLVIYHVLVWGLSALSVDNFKEKDLFFAVLFLCFCFGGQRFLKNREASVQLPDIICRSIKVIDESGQARCFIDKEGCIEVYSKEGKWARISGRAVELRGEDGETMASMHMGEHGGGVEVFGKEGEQRAEMSITEHNVNVTVYGKEGGVAVMHIYDHESERISYESGEVVKDHHHGGAFTVFGKGGIGKADMRVSEDDASVEMYGREGKVEVLAAGGEGKAVMSVNAEGNGVVNTWDKNGDRLN